MDDKDDRIKARAHEIWEREGYAHGEHHRHWHQAVREIEEEEGGLSEKADRSLHGDKDAGIALQSDDAGMEPLSGVLAPIPKVGRKKKG